MHHEQKSKKSNPFHKLGITSPEPVLLAPLAGVSDHPFRRVAARLGADLTYVEMISATALLYQNRRTLGMMKRHPEEGLLGIQITGKSADETARAIAVLNGMSFEAIDINMGCPVKKVVNAGCGSAILRDPERVRQTVRLCRQETDKVLSVKIRLGWDRESINAIENAQAAAESGADFITVHGRTRACDYAVPVDLLEMAKVKKAVSIPVIGNGNIFSYSDFSFMIANTGVDGGMVSRGALGNPWVFAEIKARAALVDLSAEAWFQVVLDHLKWQQEEYGDQPYGAIAMRKHLLWYSKGFVGGRKVREAIGSCNSILEAKDLISGFYDELRMSSDGGLRLSSPHQESGRFLFDPKFDMDRRIDAGIEIEEVSS